MTAKWMARVWWLLVAASLCAACVSHAVKTQTPMITFTAGSIPGDPQYIAVGAPIQAPGPRTFRDFIVEADGSVVGFSDAFSQPYRAYRWRAGKWSPAYNIQLDGTVCDAVQAPDGKWYVLSLRSPNESQLYRYDGSSFAQIATIAGNLILGTIHPSSDGTVWVAANGLMLYGVKDGKTIAHELFPGSQTVSAAFVSLFSLQAPGHGLWFWPQADNRVYSFNELFAAKGFQVYNDKQWRTVLPPGGRIDGAVMIDSKAILCAARDKGMFSISLSDGSIKELNWTLPEKESCEFLHKTSSNHVLAITARPAAQSALLQNSDVGHGKLVVFKNGSARVLLDGIDGNERIEWRPGPFVNGRPVVDTPQGTFIATVGRGIVFIPSDASRARRLDWHFNIPTPNVIRMRVRDNLLYLLDRFTGLAIVDWTKLLRTPDESQKGRWNVYTIAAEPVAEPAAAPDGAIWWLDRSKLPGQLNCWRDGKLTSVPLEGSGFNGLGQSTAADAQGGIWLIPQSPFAPVARFQHGTWSTFINADAAWKSMALEQKDNPSYGFVDGCSACPVFGGNGRVAYRDSSSSIHYRDGIAYQDTISRTHYFDGAEWHTNPLPNGISSSAPLSFDKGVLVIRDLGRNYQLLEDKWQLLPGQIPGSFGVETPFAAMAAPASFPGDRSRCRIFIRDKTNTLWAGNPEELYHGVDDAWVRFPTIGTPLSAAAYLTRILTDGSGDLWFVLNNGPFSQLVRYHDGGKAPIIQWAAPPPAVSKTARTEFYCRVSQRKNGSTILRYRIDERDWRQISSTAARRQIVVENLPDGMHKVEVRAYDETLRSSQLLTSKFEVRRTPVHTQSTGVKTPQPLKSSVEVRRNYDSEIKALIQQLRDSNKRESTARALVSIGRPAVPALTSQNEKADAQLRWWIQAVLDEISQNEKTKEK
jgi:hypothetical protein